MQQQSVRPTAAQNEVPVMQKLPYASPTVTFVPLKLDERVGKEATKGTFSVPVGCC